MSVIYVSVNEENNSIKRKLFSLNIVFEWKHCKQYWESEYFLLYYTIHSLYLYMFSVWLSLPTESDEMI